MSSRSSFTSSLDKLGQILNDDSQVTPTKIANFLNSTESPDKNELKSALDTLTDQMVRVANKYDSVCQKFNDVQGELSECQSNLRNSEKSLTKAQKECNKLKKKNNSLKEKNQHLQQNYTNYVMKTDQLQKNFHRSVEIISKFQVQVQNLKAMNQKKSKQISQLTNVLEEIMKRDLMNRKNDASGLENNQTSDKNEELVSDLVKKLMGNIDDFGIDDDKINLSDAGDLNQIIPENEEKEQRYRQIVENNEKLSNDIELANTEIASLKKLIEKMSGSEQQLNETNSQLLSVKKELNLKEDEINSLKNNEKKLNNEIITLKNEKDEEIDQLKNQINELIKEEQVNSEKQEILHKEQINELLKQISDLEKQKQETEDKNTAELNNRNEKINQLNEQISELKKLTPLLEEAKNNEINAKSERIAELETNISKLEKQKQDFEKTKNELDEMKTKLQLIESNNSHLKSENSQIKEENEELKQKTNIEINMLKGQINHHEFMASAQLKNKEEELQLKISEIQEKEKTINNLQEEGKDFKKHIEMLENQIISVKIESETISKELNETRKENENLTNKLEEEKIHMQQALNDFIVMSKKAFSEKTNILVNSVVEKKCSELRLSLFNTQQLLKDKTDELDKLKVEQEQSQRDNANRTKQILDNANSKSKELLFKLEDIKKSNQELKQENDELLKQIKDLENSNVRKHEIKDNEIHSKSEQIKELENKILELKTQSHNLIHTILEITGTEKHFENLQEDIAAQLEVDKKSNEINQIEAALKSLESNQKTISNIREIFGNPNNDSEIISTSENYIEFFQKIEKLYNLSDIHKFEVINHIATTIETHKTFYDKIHMVLTSNLNDDQIIESIQTEHQFYERILQLYTNMNINNTNKNQFTVNDLTINIESLNNFHENIQKMLKIENTVEINDDDQIISYLKESLNSVKSLQNIFPDKKVSDFTKSVQSLISHQNDEYEKLKSQFEAQKKELDDVSQKLQECEKELNSARFIHVSSESQLQKLKKNITDKDQIIENLKQKLLVEEHENSKLAKECDEITNKKLKLTEAFNDLKNEVETLKGELRKTQSQK